jgi:hypothetical protein
MQAIEPVQLRRTPIFSDPYRLTAGVRFLPFVSRCAHLLWRFFTWVATSTVISLDTST